MAGGLWLSLSFNRKFYAVFKKSYFPAGSKVEKINHRRPLNAFFHLFFPQFVDPTVSKFPSKAIWHPQAHRFVFTVSNDQIHFLNEMNYISLLSEVYFSVAILYNTLLIILLYNVTLEPYGP